MTARALFIACLISLNFFCNSTISSWEILSALLLMIGAIRLEKRMLARRTEFHCATGAKLHLELRNAGKRRSQRWEFQYRPQSAAPRLPPFQSLGSPIGNKPRFVFLDR